MGPEEGSLCMGRRVAEVMGCSQVGKAADFGSVIRRFESSHPSL